MDETGGNDNDDFCKLSPIDSAIVCEILKDLEKQLELAKFAFIKSQLSSSDSPHLAKPAGTVVKNTSEENESEVTNGEPCNPISGRKGSLEEPSGESVKLAAELEYEKLCQEFASFNCRKNSRPEPKFDENGRKRNENLHKFERDMDYLKSIIQKTITSLQRSNSFDILRTSVAAASLEMNREATLTLEIARTQERISQLRRQIVKVRKETSLLHQSKLGDINSLQDRLHLTRVEATKTLETTSMYFEAERCNITCNHRNEMEDTTKEINSVKGQADRDIHCLSVMASWTEDFCEELETKIDEWKLKLRRDEFAMEMRMDAKRKAIRTQEELIKSLNETIAERLEELAPWEEEKEVERQERLAHMRRYYSARKIQRWWRGYMVKLKLYKRRKLKAKS